MSAAAPGGENDGAVGKGTPKGSSLAKQIEKWTPVVADMLKVQSELDGNDGYGDLDLLGNFADNHDEQRIAASCSSDEQRVMHALTLVMLTRGVPIIYQGIERQAGTPRAYGRLLVPMP